jgi:hypothetical protein
MMAGGLGDELLELRATTRRVVRAAAALRALTVRARVDAIVTASERLRDERHAYGRALRHELQTSSGLSSEAIEWGLRSTLDALGVDALRELAESFEGKPRELAAVILAGNVFSAAVRPLVLPLLVGVPVIAKASSRDDAMPRYLRKALTEVEPALGGACEVVTFGRAQSALTAALLAHAELVTVYGSDETVQDVRSVPLRGTLLARGHGLGACFVAAAGLEVDPMQTARRIALDVAAYDQRGCLSPHAAIVQAGGTVTPEAFAQLLGAALDEIGQRMPRGEVSQDAATEQMQWRGVARARGVLHEGGSYAVAFEDEAPLRPSPGHRNVGVYACADEDALIARLRAWAPHLKALGVAGEADTRGRLASLAPYVCEVGRMQAPPLDAELDGLNPLQGLAT